MDRANELRLRPLTEQDRAAIHQWPSYMGDMAQMDYALREGGWLEEFRARPRTFLFGAERHHELVAFTILAGSGPREAEFRIVLRADRTGQGLGAEIAVRTLEQGFVVHGLDRIHLIVRINNHRGLALYHRLGFIDLGFWQQEIQGELVDFRRMEMAQQAFVRRQGRTKVNVNKENNHG